MFHIFTSRAPFRRWPCIAVAAMTMTLLQTAAVGHAAAPLAGTTVTTSFHYVVSARVRPLLFWIGRDNVGDARIAVKTQGETREYELLIGSDPRRAPFSINRWGYISEQASTDAGALLGVMIESDEDTVDQARASVSSPAGSVSRFKAIRARLSGRGVETAVQHVALAGVLTTADLDSVLGQIFDREVPLKRIDLPPTVGGGFLSAMASLMDESIATYARTGRSMAGQHRRFVHGTSVYELSAISSELVLQKTGLGPERAIESRFEIRDERTGVKSPFRVAYGVDGQFAGIPLRIVYRPKWWFEAEINIVRAGD